MRQKQTGESYVAALRLGVERNRRSAQLVIGGLALACAATGIDSAERMSASPHPRAEAVRLAADTVCRVACEPPAPAKTVKPRVPAAKHVEIKTHPKKAAVLPRPTVRPSAAPVHTPVHLMRTFTNIPPAGTSRHQVSVMRRPIAPNDISFPQCKLGFPEAAPLGIVGVNQGHPLSANPCLKDEVGLYKSYQVYVNADYPGKEITSQYQNSPQHCGAKDETCFAYNYGYSGGVYAVNYALSQGVDNPTGLWLDVETGNKWRGSPAVHRADLQGEVDALKQAGAERPIGFYSTVYMWNQITGGWQNDMPSWIASGWNTYDKAAPFCQDHNFTGGPTVMAQYTQQFDQNVLC